MNTGTIVGSPWRGVIAVACALVLPGVLRLLGMIEHGAALGWVSLAALAVLLALMFVLDHLFTWRGRRMLAARMARWRRYEFWSPWVFYAPLVPLWAVLSIRARHPLAFTACNPGIGAGGGLIGESKWEIMRSMSLGADPLVDRRSPVCPTFVVPGAALGDREDPGRAAGARAEHVLRLMEAHPEVLHYPVILKPDAALRGFGLRLARSNEDVLAYCGVMTRAFVVQPFHPGPHEVGVMWFRTPGSKSGRVFSVTLKTQPVVVGDGERTLEALILRHPRYRLQAATFLNRHWAQRDRVLARGERLSLAVAGNHCQGSLFEDGSSLITPELERAINAIACAFPDEHGAPGGLDATRMDIRCRSLDDLRCGRLDPGSIVELNGSTAESTNIYDPGKNILWAYGYLYRQWVLFYALGRERMRADHRPMTIRRTLGALWRMYHRRPGSALSD
jgi:hypothetical protein